MERLLPIMTMLERYCAVHTPWKWSHWQHVYAASHVDVPTQQLLFGRYLAQWIAQCGAAAVRLQLHAKDDEPDDDDIFILVIRTPCEQYGATAQTRSFFPTRCCVRLELATLCLDMLILPCMSCRR